MKISIITATYNSGKTLQYTLESVLKQTYDDIEYIIVDGLSTDNTIEILKKFQPLFKGKMRYVSEKDKGLYDAMNKGITMATGDVIGILNSDDFYTSNDILSLVANKLSDPSLDAIYGDVHYVDDSDLNRCVRYYSSKVFKRERMKMGFMPAHPSFYCRKKIYLECGKFDTDYKVAADFEQLLRIIYINKARIAYVHRDFVTMRTGGVSNSDLNSRVTIMKEHQKALKNNGVSCHPFLLYCRYVYKIYEVLISSYLYKQSLKQKK